MEKLTSIEFVDLYLGETFSEISGLGGSDTLIPVPEELVLATSELRALCLHYSKANREEEFSVPVGDSLFRVTKYTGMRETVFAVRQPIGEILSLSDLGLADNIIDVLLARELRGLVVVGGEMKMGKTSTVGAILHERVKAYGGMGFAVEDPPELLHLEGRQGLGRIVCIWAKRTNGGYAEQMRRAVRSGATVILIGEIRDPETATEAIRAGLNGHLILCTIHCEDIEGGISRLYSLAAQNMDQPGTMLAKGLAAFVWQTLETIQPRPGHYAKRLRAQMLVAKDNESVKMKISEGNFAGLIHDIEQQASKSAWVGTRTSK